MVPLYLSNSKHVLVEMQMANKYSNVALGFQKKTMAESKLLSLAEKEAAIWERKLLEEFHDKKKSTKSEIAFNEFVQLVHKEDWFTRYVTTRSPSHLRNNPLGERCRH